MSGNVEYAATIDTGPHDFQPVLMISNQDTMYACSLAF